MAENQNYILAYPGEEIDRLLGKIDDLENATPSADGTMSAEDKTKLDSLDPTPVEKVSYAKMAGVANATLGNAREFLPIAQRWDGLSGAALIRELRGKTILNVDEIQGRYGGSILTTGINLWDGKIEPGDYDNDGLPVDDEERERSVNPVYVAGGQSYVFLGADAFVVQCSIDGSALDSRGVDKGEEFTVQDSCSYLLFSVPTGENNICISFADSSSSGFHAPKQSTIDLSVLEWTSSGERVFPYGMDGHGDIFDRAIADEDGFIRTAIIAMGRRDYQEGDENDPSVITDNVTTAYPLEIPRTVILDTPVPATFEVINGGLIYASPDIVDGDLYPSVNMMVSFPEEKDSPDTQMSDTSTNPVQNKVIKEYVDEGLAEKVPADGVAPNLIAGGSVSEFGDPASERFLFKQTEGGSGKAWLKKIAGRTVSVNQLVGASMINGGTSSSGVTVINNNDGSVSFTGIVEAFANLVLLIGSGTFIAGHKYYARGGISSGIYFQLFTFSDTGGGIVFTAPSTARFQDETRFRGQSGQDFNNLKIWPEIIDLTQAGLDTLITTPAEFEAWQMEQFGHKGYLGYTPGKLVSVNPTGVLTTGRNVWDEQWVVGIIDSRGTYNPTGNRVVSAHFIKVIPNTAYYKGTLAAWVYFYDVNQQYISNSSSGIFTTPTNCAFIKFYSSSTYGTTYNHDICINISDPSFNGQYEPYNSHTLPLDFTEHFPEGLNGVNDVVDEVVSDEFGKFAEGDVRFGKVDLGTLDWRDPWWSDSGRLYAILPLKAPGRRNIIYALGPTINNDNSLVGKIGICGNSVNTYIYVGDANTHASANDFIESLNGVEAIFELATPQHVTFTDPSDAVYPVTEGGTEQVLPVNGSDPATIAPDFQISRGAGYMKKADVVQEQGSATDKVMSQKTVTDALNDKAETQGHLPLFHAGLADAIVDTDSAGTEQKFISRISGGDGAAFYRKVKGNTLMWNQLVAIPATSSTQTAQGLTITDNRDGSYTINGTSTSGAYLELANTGGRYLNKDHKCFWACFLLSGTISGSAYVGDGFVSDDVECGSAVILDAVRIAARIYIKAAVGVVFTNARIAPMSIDLTRLGLDYITTPAEFEALFPLDYYAYDPGSPIHNKAQAIQTTGINVWDEEWENGYYNTSGTFVSNALQICTKNYIPVIEGRTYYINKTNNANGLCYFDSAKIFIRRVQPFGPSFTIPEGVSYIKINMGTPYGSTYLNDICINLSDESINGKYFPYQAPRQIDVDVTTRKASDDSVPFPNGTRSAEAAADWFDEDGGAIVMDEVDLGSLTWTYSSGRFSAPIANVKGAASASSKANAACSRLMLATADQTADASYDQVFALTTVGASNPGILVRHSGYTDAAAFKTAMTGVKLVFEKNTPTEFTWKNKMSLAVKVSKYGTEKMLPENTSVPASAPFRADTTYSISVAELVRILSNL